MKPANHLLSSIAFVSAGAGTGKTYRLTEKIVEAVLAGVEPERIMATTFTVKAAAELRRRVRESLASQGRPDLGARVADGYIGTVHSLGFRLLKEYAIDAGISPDVDMLPEGDTERIFNIAVAAAIQNAVDSMEPPALRMERVGGGTRYSAAADWRKDVRTIVADARANGMTAHDLRAHASAAVALWEDTVRASTDAPPPTFEDLLEAATAAVEQLEAVERPKKGTQKVTEQLRQFLRDSADGAPVRWRTWVELATVEPTRDAAGLLDDLHRIARRVCEVPTFLQDFRTLIEGVYGCAAEALDQFTAYKRERGVTDYEDLETSFLQLLTDRGDVQQGIRDRIGIVMVDEFQDTSPMQLALFIELHKVVGRSVWVGDPKQAIYGFRGTDPVLMKRIAELLDNHETLSRSWRSRQAILDITNAIFTQALYDTPRESVELTLPRERERVGSGGTVSAWYLDSSNKGGDAAAIAVGVKAFLSRYPERRPGDIAILCRSNNHCSSVADALLEQGIRASVSAGLLKETRESQIVLSGLRYLADGADTIALVDLMALTSSDSSLLAALISEPEATLAACKDSAIPTELTRIRQTRDRLSVSEAVDSVIAATDIMTTLSGWSRSDVRRANVEALRGLADEYEDLQRAARAPASLHGFVAYVDDGKTGQAQGSGPDSCVVTTYHGAKGLEWPVVVLAELDKTFQETIFGVHVVPAERFDPEHPLCERRIHYWPWPFGAKRTFPALDELLETTPMQQHIRTVQRDESVRLLYVGATRPKEHLVFALRNRAGEGFAKPGDSWLQQLTDRNGMPLIQWPDKQGKTRLSIGTLSVPVDISVYSPSVDRGRADGSIGAAQGTRPLQPVRGNRKTTQHPPRRILPSMLTHDEARYSAEELARIAPPISAPKTSPGTDPDDTALGTAVHAAFSVAPAHRIPGKVTDILRRWDISADIAAAVVEAVDALEALLRTRHTVSALYREWPVQYRFDDGQEMRGWIDLLVETPHGWVIVDHKTYHGKDPSEAATRYGPQLAHYRRAVERATGSPVIETLISFVLLGTVYNLQEV